MVPLEKNHALIRVQFVNIRVRKIISVFLQSHTANDVHNAVNSLDFGRFLAENANFGDDFRIFVHAKSILVDLTFRSAKTLISFNLCKTLGVFFYTLLLHRFFHLRNLSHILIGPGSTTLGCVCIVPS